MYILLGWIYRFWHRITDFDTRLQFLVRDLQSLVRGHTTAVAHPQRRDMMFSHYISIQHAHSFPTHPEFRKNIKISWRNLRLKKFQKNRKIEIFENLDFPIFRFSRIFDFWIFLQNFQTQISPWVLNIFSKFRMRWIAVSLLYRYVMIIHHSLTMGVDQSGRMTTCKSRVLICNLVS